ncbi:FtsX-like permease family protein [Amycolatopsis sp. NPDC051903]|uniref:ABC transporter permease n=1 Tax=Amycolatopsis sp. NPDC051903 TaxID=3363936 RepID=UPI0037B726AF
MTAPVSVPAGRPERTSRRRDFALGVRLAVGGGRTSWIRFALGTFGIGLAVTVLLLFASIGHVLRDQDARVGSGLPDTTAIAGVSPTEFVRADLSYRTRLIEGAYLHGTGPASPVPPGLSRLPGAGEIVVSPALADLLHADPGLRARFPGTIAGTIDRAGLRGPADLAFFAGSGPLPPAAEFGPRAQSVYSFGSSAPQTSTDPTLLLLAILSGVAVLVPVLIFVSVSSRIAGAQRDRRLAALRLAGVGGRQVRRIAAAETLVGAAAGLVLGAVAFLGVRQLTPSFELLGWSAYAEDVVPSPLFTVLIVLLVPALAVGTVLVSLRRTIIEPLGVVREAKPVRRRLWWRVVPIGLGAALLALFAPGAEPGSVPWIAVVATGSAALLAGVPAILPWLLEPAVGRLRGGSPSWRLATRRLQLDSGTPARVVCGVAVVLAGSIALQLVLLSMTPPSGAPSTGDDWVTVATTPAAAGRVAADLAHAPAARQFGLATQVRALAPDGASRQTITVASCATIERVLDVRACADGDAFLPRYGTPSTLDPGTTLTLVGEHDQAAHPRALGTFTLPAKLTPVAQRNSTGPGPYVGEVLLTPAAAAKLTPPADSSAEAWVRVPPGQAGAADLIAAAVGDLTWQVFVTDSGSDLLTADQPTFAPIRSALDGGSLFTLLLAGVSLLVLALEQVRERRRPLALLAAAGVPRSVLSRSVLWQTAVPVVLGVLVAAGTGVGLAALITRMLGLNLVVDWATIGVLSGTGLALVFAVPALTLPALRSTMHPTSLRTE